MVRIARTGAVVVLSKMRLETIMAQLLRPSFPPPFLVYLGPGSESLLELVFVTQIHSHEPEDFESYLGIPLASSAGG